MPVAPRLQFPQPRPDPKRSLLQRLGVAGGIVVVIALLPADELGGPPDQSMGLPIALIRGATRIPFDDAAFQRTEPGDVVVYVKGRHGPSSAA